MCQAAADTRIGITDDMPSAARDEAGILFDRLDERFRVVYRMCQADGCAHVDTHACTHVIIALGSTVSKAAVQQELRQPTCQAAAARHRRHRCITKSQSPGGRAGTVMCSCDGHAGHTGYSCRMGAM